MSDKYPTTFNAIQERLVETMKKKTQNDDDVFFRLVVAYFFCKVASMMRTHVVLPGDESIPVNMYAINLAPSGSGKGHSIRLMEQRVINGFRTEFLNKAFPELAEAKLAVIAARRARKNRTDPDNELVIAEAEFQSCGPLLFSFDSATAAAIKQMRTKLQMSGAGSMNLEIDEIGSNLIGQTEALNAFLELYDVGQIKPKLVKHTKDNARGEDLIDPTPTNAMMFGTSAKLLNGTKTEDEYYSMLETGFARRCFFGYSRIRKQTLALTPQQMLKALDDKDDQDYMVKLSNRFTMLADPSNFNTRLEMNEDVRMAYMVYRTDCQRRAERISEYHEAKRAEMAHRHFKAVKLAAAYAFIDNSTVYLTLDHWEQAVAMAEVSGQAFNRMINRDKPYAKLARYIAGTEEQLTHADLADDFLFYPKPKHERRDILEMATAYGYKHGIYIKREQATDGIEFFSGRMLEETDLQRMIVSYSEHITQGYRDRHAPFDVMHQLVSIPGRHWVAHHLDDGYRDEQHVVPGANIAVIDVDSNVSIETASFLMEEYKFLLHTTKRHTEAKHRFRMLLPLSHVVELDSKDYKEFMTNIYSWLPFDCDQQTNQRSRKWLTCKGKYWYNDGELLDALQFIPKTKAAEERRKIISTQGSMNALERWYVNQAKELGRNNVMIKFVLFLVEQGHDIDSVRDNVLRLNSKMLEPLPETELLTTVLVTASKRIHERDTK